MPRKTSRVKRVKIDQFDNISAFVDSEKANSKSLHVTINRRTILQIGQELEKICEGLRDPTYFEEKILELEKLKDSYIRIGTGSL